MPYFLQILAIDSQCISSGIYRYVSSPVCNDVRRPNDHGVKSDGMFVMTSNEASATTTCNCHSVINTLAIVYTALWQAEFIKFFRYLKQLFQISEKKQLFWISQNRYVFQISKKVILDIKNNNFGYPKINIYFRYQKQLLWISEITISDIWNSFFRYLKLMCQYFRYHKFFFGYPEYFFGYLKKTNKC